MELLQQSFTVSFNYKVYFTEGLFSLSNDIFKKIIESGNPQATGKLLFVIDSGVAETHPRLIEEIQEYIDFHLSDMEVAGPYNVVPGGELVKNTTEHFDQILESVNKYGICRQSYIVAIGGGAVLDMVGYAASVAHRGVRHIRIPTTVLSQNDSGIGVKNGINAFGKKNFIGNFCPPYAVLNDYNFLTTLNERDWRSGVSEAIKVALIRDKTFFEYIKIHAAALCNRDMAAMKYVIYRCAELHLRHIAGGDAFESGSARPLDFGHWAAHKLEQLTSYSLRHGEAVAIGIALDSTYSFLGGKLSKAAWEEIIELILDLGFQVYIPEMSREIENDDHPHCLTRGLTEFREHIGGKLCITLLNAIGQGEEVHEMNSVLVVKSIELLKQIQSKITPSPATLSL